MGMPWACPWACPLWACPTFWCQAPYPQPTPRHRGLRIRFDANDDQELSSARICRDPARFMCPTVGSGIRPISSSQPVESTLGSQRFQNATESKRGLRRERQSPCLPCDGVP
ncbi:hypothetical protein DFJ74DRAFT_480904 [Hyaloraphidium curvatum]|nr:hypothetical protein DFJ74DRAFT_480904 [Hyaloraphidium curvatum]